MGSEFDLCNALLTDRRRFTNWLQSGKLPVHQTVVLCWFSLRTNLFHVYSIVPSLKSCPFLVCGLITEVDNLPPERAFSYRVAYYALLEDPVHVVLTVSIHKKSSCLGEISSSHGTLTLLWQISPTPTQPSHPPPPSSFRAPSPFSRTLGNMAPTENCPHHGPGYWWPFELNIITEFLWFTSQQHEHSIVYVRRGWSNICSHINALRIVKTMQSAVRSDDYFKITFFKGLLFTCPVNRLSKPSVS